MTSGSKEQLGLRKFQMSALKTTQPVFTFFPLGLRGNVGHCRIKQVISSLSITGWVVSL